MKKGLPSTLVIALLVLLTLASCVSGVPRVSPQLQAATPIPPELVSPYPPPSAVPASPVDPYPIPSATRPAKPTNTPGPTWTPEPAITTPTVYSTSTPILAAQLKGEWSRYTTADGFCTDSPVLMGRTSIGTGTTTLCSFHHGEWMSSLVVPQGTTVTASWSFPPGGGLEVATNVGICYYGHQEWRCKTQADGFLYPGIRQILNIYELPVYLWTDSVIYYESMFHETVYRIPEIVGAADAIPTRMAISGESFGEGYLPAEIWVGTNGYGIVVIQPETGEITHYTIEDGLPSNEIRDISSPSCGSFCDFRDVWAATDQGIAQWDGSQWKTYTTADGLPSNDIRGVSSWQRNAVWAASVGGAAYFDGQDWRAFTQTNGLSEGELTGVQWFGDEIMFSTPDSGLVVFTINNLSQ